MQLPASWGVDSHVAPDNTEYLAGADPAIRVTVPGLPDRSQPVGHEVRSSFSKMGLASARTTVLSYDVFVPIGADYGSTGGKLPGLAGALSAGAIPTGGDPVDGTAWSARLMFHPDGGIIGYLYVPEAAGVQKGQYGIGLGPLAQNPMVLRRGEWNSVRVLCRMNTVGVANGWFLCSLNGVQGIRYGDVRYQSNPLLNATHLEHQFRYGGSGSDVGPTTDETWTFRRHRISTHWY